MPANVRMTNEHLTIIPGGDKCFRHVAIFACYACVT